MKSSLINYDEKIQTLIVEDESGNLENDCTKSEEYLDSVSRYLIRCDTKLKQISAAERDGGSFGPGSSVFPRVKLPNVELPKFNGRPEEFNRFLECFEAIINKFQLSQFEKYSYLLQQLSGSAREIVLSVPHDNICYSSAIDLLASAFSSKIKQQFSVIEKLLELKLESKDDFHHWISEVRIISNQLAALDIDSKIFAQYFVWFSMSGRFKEVFMAVNNCSEPDVDKIIDTAFQVASRVENDFKIPTVEKKFAMAVSVDKKIQSNYGCQLCNSVNSSDAQSHKIYNCPKFDTPLSKLNKIKELKGCTRCGLLNHSVNQCNFRFNKKCKTCDSWHAFFLCSETVKNAGKNEKEKKELKIPNKNESKVNKFSKHSKDNSDIGGRETFAVEYTVMNAQINNNVLLPTFSAKYAKENGGNVSVRTLYDSASQVTFISEHLLGKIKHKIVRDKVTLKIIGFNESRDLETKIVGLSLDVKEETRKFDAVVTPEILTKIPVNSLTKICKEFRSHSVPLADKCLHPNNDGKVDILLGVDNAHILPIQSCSFGGKQKSLVYHTGLGIMLAGDIDVLTNNLSHIGSVREFVKLVRGK